MTAIEVNGVDTPNASFDIRVSGSTRDASRALSIKCNSGCPKPQSYVEDINDFPVAGFRVGDDSSIFFFLLTTGSAYHVLAYQLDSSGVRKVLDVGYRVLLGVGFRNGHEYLELSDNRVTSIYLWNGKRFVKK